MRQFDNQGPGSGDGDILRRIKDHADAVEAVLPTISGADIRQRADAASVGSNGSIRRGRGRAPFLAAAAAVVLAGGAIAISSTRSSDRSSLEVAPADDIGTVASVEDGEAAADADERPPTPSVPVDDAAENEVDETESTTSPGPVDLMPQPVQAAEFGAAEVRYLPPPDSGFVVSSGSQVLLSEADLTPEAATPVKSQRLALPATDPTDRRSIIIAASTYADAAAADAAIEAEPTPHGVPGEPMDVDGRLGAWRADEGFAPFSAGNPMRIIGAARVRLDATSVLDVSAPDVPRAEIERLISSVAVNDDGSIEVPSLPAGFDSAERIEGASALAAITHDSAPDYLSLTLVGVNGEQVELLISPESDGLDPADAHFTTASGYGWIEFGLFRETVVSFVGPEATFILVNYDGQVSADDLITLAESLQLVDDKTWADRLTIAPLFRAPVSEVVADD